MAVDMTNVTGAPRIGDQPDSPSVRRPVAGDRPPSPSEVLQDECEPIVSSGLHVVSVEEHGWLIEHQLTRALWLYLNGRGIQWTTDSNDALRFARKEDAERFRMFARLGIGFSVTEHTWS